MDPTKAKNTPSVKWFGEKWEGSYFRLKNPLAGKADLNKQTASRPLYAAVSIRLEPLAIGQGVQKQIQLPAQDLDDADQQACIEATFQGAFDALWTIHFHPIKDVNITLTRFFYDKPQSARVIFWEAGFQAVRNALDHPGGAGMTETNDRWDFISRG